MEFPNLGEKLLVFVHVGYAHFSIELFMETVLNVKSMNCVVQNKYNGRMIYCDVNKSFNDRNDGLLFFLIHEFIVVCGMTDFRVIDK